MNLTSPAETPDEGMAIRIPGKPSTPTGAHHPDLPWRSL